MKKIIVRMRGGLGNQLFILAFAYKVAKELNTDDYEIVLDNREYKNYKIRNFEILDMINDNKIRIYDESKDHSNFYEAIRYIYHIMQKILPSNMPILKFMSKKGYLFSKRNADCVVPKNRSNIYIYGYFQDYRMTQEVKKSLMEKIKWENIPNELDLTNYKYIAISIRCGQDYVEQGWPVCNEEYYRDAIKKIVIQKYKNRKYKVLIFADNIIEAKRMNLHKEAQYVIGKTAIEQIEMMSYCDDFVIANSSFSWWGAYLGLKSDSIVIAPKYWYRNNTKTENSFLNYPNMKII